MQRTRHPPEAKARALELLAEFGVAEAAERTGIPIGTIASWGHRAGVSSPCAEGYAERRAQLREAFATRRVSLGNRMGEVAAETLEQLDTHVRAGKTRQARELAGALAVLVDKAQLLTGGATGRTEVSVPDRTPEQEAELAQILAFRRGAA